METMTGELDADVPARLWRTSEMSLVAYLMTLGRQPLRMEVDKSKTPASCYWIYDEEDGTLADDVLAFLEGSGLVEPKNFNNLMASLKDTMFGFLRANGVTNRR